MPRYEILVHRLIKGDDTLVHLDWVTAPTVNHVKHGKKWANAVARYRGANLDVLQARELRRPWPAPEITGCAKCGAEETIELDNNIVVCANCGEQRQDELT